MAAPYTIYFTNRTGFRWNYTLFADTPVYTSNAQEVSSGDLDRNIYIRHRRDRGRAGDLNGETPADGDEPYESGPDDGDDNGPDDIPTPEPIEICSNVIESVSLPNGNWDNPWQINIGLTNYAWCGTTTSTDLRDVNAQVEVSQVQAVVVGESDDVEPVDGEEPEGDPEVPVLDNPGSTLALHNDGGKPSFVIDREFDYKTRKLGAFGINSGFFDFLPKQNFAVGTACITGSGKVVPTSTVVASTLSQMTFAPRPIFYITGLPQPAGSFVDPSIWRDARPDVVAKIDFTDTLYSAAEVRKIEGGGFEVNYLTPKKALELARTSPDIVEPIKIHDGGVHLKNLSDTIGNVTELLKGVQEENRRLWELANQPDHDNGHQMDSHPPPPKKMVVKNGIKRKLTQRTKV